MALRGNLRDFSLPDVFQLVQLSGKTGVLRITGPEAEGGIWFREGEVFFAQSNWRREQLGERLVAAQRITPAALARALDLRAIEPDGGRRLGQILVDEGYITPQVLETFVQEQIQDTIFDLMRWDEGDFDFEVLPGVVHEDIGLSVSIENIVMEGSRRLEEWQRIKKKVPSTGMVFKMATAPGEGTFEISLKPVEWSLLLLIDGTRSVRELAVETHSTDFDVARVIYGLFSAGLLEVPSDEEIERLRADRARREDSRAKLQASPFEPEMAVTESVDSREAIVAERGTEGLESRFEPEEPAFLGGGETPSTDDMAVFEQMMASVLAPQDAAESVPAEPLAGSPVAEATSERVAGLDFFPDETGEIESPFVPYPPSFEAHDADASAEEGPVAPESAEGSDAFEVAPRTGDFEVDLRALGLGEYPEELLRPIEPPASLAETEPPSEPRLPMSEVAAGRTQDAPLQGRDDLDSLLASLGGAAAEGLISSGTGFGDEPAAEVGYISTDVFLAEFDGDGLSSGLGDELTALTGGATARVRPVATVNKLPEAGEAPMLHRDQLVDRALLEKIIEGIENL